MILVSEINSVNEKALLVKQVLLTVNGFILSGSSTTFETKGESVIPDRWAPKYLESGVEDRTTTLTFSLFMTSATVSYTHLTLPTICSV